MVELFDQAAAQILLLPDAVQIWMRWLNIVFLLGVFFVRTHKTARWALVAYVISFPLAAPIFYFTRDVSMLGVPHLLFWAPLLLYIFSVEYRNAAFRLLSLYGVWIVLLSLTITISIVFDAKAVYDYVARMHGL